MPSKKYLIYDADEIVGHLLIKEPATMPAFQHVDNALIKVDGPIGDVVLLLGALAGFTGVAWLGFGPGWIAPTIGLSITAGLAGIKAWRGSLLPEPAEPTEPEPQKPIRLEHISQDKTHWLIGELDEAITMPILESVAKAMMSPRANWSRPYLTKNSKVSQSKYKVLTDDLLNFGYLQPLPNGANGYNVTIQGTALFRRIAAK